MWGFKLKKLNLGIDLHKDGSLRKNLTHQFEVDNNPRLVQVSFSTAICIGIITNFLSFFLTDYTK